VNNKETKAKEIFQTLLNAAPPTFENCFRGDIIPEYVIGEISSISSPAHREAVVKTIAKKAGISVQIVRESTEFERAKKGKAEESKKEESECFSLEELDKAKELLKSPNILEEMLDLTTRRRYVEEEINKMMLFLSFISRRMITSISTIVKGASASGKSDLVKCILSLILKKDVLSFSFITPKALPHFARDLSHKILFIQEQPGSQGADYSIRTTLSEGEISIAISIKDEASGNFTTIEKRIPAVGMVFVETTTRERVHIENQARVFDLYMDESKKQTEQVLTAEAEQDDQLDPDLEAETKIWRAAQTLIENRKVNIPYSKEPVKAFSKDKVRVQRDFPRFLSLIKVHTLLYQFQREKDAKGHFIATNEDLYAVLPIAESVLIQSHKEVSPKLERVLESIGKEFGVNQEFSFGELEDKVEFKERTLRYYLKSLTALDFISHNGKTGKESRYMLLSLHCLNASMSHFSDNCRKLLENIEANSDSPQSAPLPQSDDGGTDKGNGANRGENGFASKNNNDDSGLDLESSSEAKRQKKSNNASHSGACDCPECCPESDLSGDKTKADSEIKRIIYKTDDDMYQVVFAGEDGKQLIHIITPDCSEFEEIRRGYEQQRSE
jgi:hypothetical protein